MRRKSKLFVLFLAAVMTVAAAEISFPAGANAFDLPDPRVALKEGASAPAAVDVGGVFDLDLTFTHTFDKRISDTHPEISKAFNDNKDKLYAVISVSCENGSILNAKSRYTVSAVWSTEDSESKVTYDLYIPQKNLKRIGSGSGVLSFAITYYSDPDTTKPINRLTYPDADIKKDIPVPTFFAAYQAFPRLAGASSGSENTSRLSVESYRLDGAPVKEGKKFNLILSVKNSGGAACNNVTAVLGLADNSGLSIDGATDTRSIPQLAAGASGEIAYPMACVPKMASGSYAVGVTLSGDGCAPSASKIYIPVAGTKDAASSAVGDSKPQIIIESYDYGGKAVTGGQEFDLVMNIRNTGSIAIENCKMTVGSAQDSTASASAGSVFTPAKSSNTFFISRLSPGASVQKEIALLPKTDAAPNSYGVDVTFKYDAVVDGKRQSLDASETITVPLTQPDRFEVSEPELDEQMFSGQPGQLNIGYVNKGKSGIYNLAVKLSGNFTTKDGNSNIGNLESGASDTYQASVTPNGEGALKGTATFSYEDSTGKTKTIVKDFSCTVVAAAAETALQTQKELANAEKPRKSGSPWWVWPAAVGGLVAAAVVTVKLLKKRKAEKIRKLEESDDDGDIPWEENKK